MPAIDQVLQQLNSEQIKPVLDTEGAVLVIAGAGSGKTRVLTSRIAYLIDRKGVSPDRILAITFTNKAADEMKGRIFNMTEGASGVWVSTIHSMCVKILRLNIDRLGYDRNFTIYDETDKDKVLKEVFSYLQLNPDKLFKSCKAHISNAKNECLGPEEYKKAYSHVNFIEEIVAVYTEYERVLQRSNSLDFDDLLYKTYRLFTLNKDVQEYYAEKFQYVHIDEFQDTNTVQFALAQMLSSKHNNLFVVGDDDQSIYGWRGAKIDNILNFDDIYRGAKVYKLERNYRSTKKILNLANCVISHNRDRREKTLWTENGEGVKIDTFVGRDENEEASYVAMQIKNLLSRGYFNYKDFAVFMRVNSLTRAFEQEFTKYAIPYRIYGGFRFFERKEIKDVLSYLKLVVNRYDDQAFVRAIGAPKRGIGDKTLRDLKEFATATGRPMFHAVEYLEEGIVSSGVKNKLEKFVMLINEFDKYSQNNGPSKLIEYILETTGFLDQFAEKSEENTSKIFNINELKNTAELFEKDNANSNLVDFLNSVTLSSDTDEINDGNVVTIATIHASKGLEFGCVFVCGLDENILPISRSYDGEDETEEERRLFYVAITRAKERLYITRAQSRFMYGRRDYMVQSRFLKEAYPALYGGSTNSQQNSTYKTNQTVYSQTNISSGYSSLYAKSMLKQNKPKEQSGINVSLYKTGVKVRHVKFGEGTVITTQGMGDNMIVDVAFKGVGIKKLAVKFAPMEII